MTVREFIERIEKIFGTYGTPVARNAVLKFVSDNWTMDELPGLLNYTIMHFSTRYKAQPDVAFFNKIWEEKNLESAAGKAEDAWLQLENGLKTDRSVLCTDIVTQEVILSMGGINQFMDYRKNEHHWCRKTFIETYNTLFKLPGIQKRNFRIIKNNAQILYPKYPPELFYRHDVRVIGDEAQGRGMLTEMERSSALEYKRGCTSNIGDIIKELIPVE